MQYIPNGTSEFLFFFSWRGGGRKGFRDVNGAGTGDQTHSLPHKVKGEKLFPSPFPFRFYFSVFFSHMREDDLKMVSRAKDNKGNPITTPK